MQSSASFFPTKVTKEEIEMNESEGATAGIAANQVINTTQPRPITNYKVRGVRKLATVQCCLAGAGPNGKDRIITVNKADYDEDIHGSIVKAKLPSRKKRAKAKGEGKKKSKARRKKVQPEE